jgi:hypothetical protein
MEEGPEPQEWVEKTAEEEHHHAHEERQGGEHGGSDKTTSAITAAVLAVMAALGSLLSGHAANEAILAQTRATDQWAYFQSKSTKGHLYEVAGELVKALGSSATPDAGETFKRMRAESQRYEGEKEKIQHTAEELEHHSQQEFRKHQRFALGVALFQVGIVLASVSILVRIKPLYLLSLVAGAAGLFCVVLGLVT